MLKPRGNLIIFQYWKRSFGYFCMPLERGRILAKLAGIYCSVRFRHDVNDYPYGRYGIWSYPKILFNKMVQIKQEKMTYKLYHAGKALHSAISTNDPLGAPSR